MKAIKLDLLSRKIQRANVKRNEELVIDLPSSGSIGYLWELSGQDKNIKLIDHNIIPNVEQIGASGTDRFVVSSNKNGEQNLVFDLKAPWEDNPIRSLFVRIKTE